TLSGSRVEIIGWAFDLLAQHVTLSAGCLEKSLHGFISVREFRPMPIKRYNELRGRTNMHSFVTLGPVARMAVLMLRTLTLLIGVDEPHFARPFESWEPPEDYTGLIAQFDGSLKGSGMKFLAKGADAIEHPVGLAAVDFRSFGFGVDSGYQNTAEYISAAAASRGAYLLQQQGVLIDGKPIKGVWLRGNSSTALKWGVTSRVKSTLALNACLVTVMQMVKCNMPVLGTEYIPAPDNPDPDEMSRVHEKGLTLEQWRAQHPSLSQVPILDLKMETILPLCDPALCIDNEDAFCGFWARARDAFE
ncbi:hypothetical protein B484DRAFT_412460, partial [Ochromonadaceae sp. CCMP2298]